MTKIKKQEGEMDYFKVFGDWMDKNGYIVTISQKDGKVIDKGRLNAIFQHIVWPMFGVETKLLVKCKKYENP